MLTWKKKHHSFAFLVFCEGNPSVTIEFPSQGASNAESLSMPWLHDIAICRVHNTTVHNICVCHQECHVPNMLSSDIQWQSSNQLFAICCALSGYCIYHQYLFSWQEAGPDDSYETHQPPYGWLVGHSVLCEEYGSYCFMIYCLRWWSETNII